MQRSTEVPRTKETETARDKGRDTEGDRDVMRRRQTLEEAFWWTEIHRRPKAETARDEGRVGSRE